MNESSLLLGLQVMRDGGGSGLGGDIFAIAFPHLLEVKNGAKVLCLLIVGRNRAMETEAFLSARAMALLVVPKSMPTNLRMPIQEGFTGLKS